MKKGRSVSLKKAMILVVAFLAGNASQSVADDKTFFGVVKLNDKTKEFDGETFTLVAWSYDPSVSISVTNSLKDYIFSINGKRVDEKIVRSARDEGIKGRWNAALGVVWCRLPKSGKLEIVFRPLALGETIDLKKQWSEMEKSFSIDVDKIETVHASTYEELAEKMKALKIHVNDLPFVELLK